MSVASDLTTFTKSITGGFPLASVTRRTEVTDAIPPDGLGGTYASNPAICAATLAVLNIFEQGDLLQKASELGQTLHEDLLATAETHREIGDVRGLGAVIAIKLLKNGGHARPNVELTAKVVARARGRGLILLSCRLYYGVLHILIPLTIEDAQIRQGLDIIAQCFAEIKQG